MKEAKILSNNTEGERRFDNMEKIENTQTAKPLKEKVDELYFAWEDAKKKKIKIPRKAKVRKRKKRKGWIGVLKIDENGNISGEKQKMSGFVYRTKDGYYHTSDGQEILFWMGKFPVVIQPSWKLNPLNLRKGVEKNETYGQPYVMARMLNDQIPRKKQSGSIIIWIIIIGAILFGVNYFLKGGA
ncbi:MAG TPA: hypothetical protein ENG87_05815 [Candidatus Pacearchaeota archaeon]|nr:hypothetical protein BMS3Abin17_00081 [archaeon BMS3Abin17]HDK42872.1 hypothetical protein [Candidatus Pacearchaeota archaeon]HDZ60171.1 hypothetical protein [Candidatus Pacearchaeota archaeon]